MHCQRGRWWWWWWCRRVWVSFVVFCSFLSSFLSLGFAVHFKPKSFETTSPHPRTQTTTPNTPRFVLGIFVSEFGSNDTARRDKDGDCRRLCNHGQTDSTTMTSRRESPRTVTDLPVITTVLATMIPLVNVPSFLIKVDCHRLA